MERRSEATSCLSFWGTLAKTFFVTCTVQRCTSAFTNSSRNTSSKAGSPSITPSVTSSLLNPRLLRSLKNSLQVEADSFAPAWKPKTSRRPSSLTPITTSTETFSTLSVTRILKLTPSIKRYFTFSSDRSLVLHRIHQLLGYTADFARRDLPA